MNQIKIMALQASHIDRIVEINKVGFPNTAWSKESLLKELEENTFARYIVLMKDDIVIGYGGMWLIIDEAHVTNIAMDPLYRGLGIGNLLVTTMIEVCKKENIHAMTLEVRKSNLVAQSLYKKHGFIQEGLRKGYYEDTKEDAVIMWKEIPY